MSSNRMVEMLEDLGLSSAEHMEAFHPRTRDREDVAVLRCARTGALLLSSTDHASTEYYADKDGFDYWQSQDRAAALAESRRDDERRAATIRASVNGARWLDFGTGAGGILDLLADVAREVLAVEPQASVREQLRTLGYTVFSDLAHVDSAELQVVTMFHVLEHLPDPVETLQALKQKMQTGGKIVVEVPHANDFLIRELDLQSFKAFTFFSEHLILHTRRTLERCLEAAGFHGISIRGVQRFGWTNHLHWLTEGKPGGHELRQHLESDALRDSYEAVLAQNDRSDTLLAFATS